MVRAVSIYRDEQKNLKARIPEEKEEYLVKPIRYFPITSSHQYIGLLKIGEAGSKTDEELIVIADCNRLDDNSRRILEEELNTLDKPERIRKIYSIKPVDERLYWCVDTNRGQVNFEVKNQQDIYIIGRAFVIIKDVNERRFILDPAEMDYRSRVFIDAYI